MKFKKFVAALSAVTMLGSLTVAVPAIAKEVSVTDYAIAASKAFQVRGTDETMTTKKSATEEKKSTESIEMTYANTSSKKAWFGAVYYFEMPDDATITSAKLTVERYDTYKNVEFKVVPLTIPSDVTLTTDNVFNYVSAANIKEATTTGSIKNTADTNPLSGDITSLYSNNQTPNAFFVYKPNQDDSNARKVMGTATLTVSATYDDGTVENATAQVGNKQYTSLNDALIANESNNNYEVRLLADYSAVTTNNKRLTFTDTTAYGENKFNIEDKTITISAPESDKKTITVKETEAAGGMLINKTGNLNLTNVNVYPYNGAPNPDKYTVGVEYGSINVSNGTITGDVKISNSATFALTDNAIVTGTVVKNGPNAKLKADSTASITSLTVSGEFNDGDIIITKLGDTNLTASQVKTLTNVGYELYTDDNGNLAIRTVEEEPMTESKGFTFVGTLDELIGKTIKVTVNEDAKTGKIPDPKGTTFTGDSTLALGIIIENVPVGADVSAVIID